MNGLNENGLNGNGLDDNKLDDEDRAGRLTQFARSLGAVRIGQSGGLIIYHLQLQPAQPLYFHFNC